MNLRERVRHPGRGVPEAKNNNSNKIKKQTLCGQYPQNHVRTGANIGPGAPWGRQRGCADCEGGGWERGRSVRGLNCAPSCRDKEMGKETRKRDTDALGMGNVERRNGEGVGMQCEGWKHIQ